MNKGRKTDRTECAVRHDWWGQWSQRNPRTRDHIGLRPAEGRCMTRVLSCYPFIVYLALSLWRKLLHLVRRSETTFHLDKWWCQEDRCTAGYLKTVSDSLPAIHMKTRKPVVALASSSGVSQSFRDSLVLALQNNQVDVVVTTVNAFGISPTTACDASEAVCTFLWERNGGSDSLLTRAAVFNTGVLLERMLDLVGAALSQHERASLLCSAASSDACVAARTMLQHKDMRDHVDNFVNLTVSDGSTALTVAVREGSSHEMFSLLVDYGANVDHADARDFCPLVHALRTAKLEDVRYLIEKCGADPNALDADQGTVLHSAAGEDSLEAVQLLLDLGASVDGAPTVQRRTPLHVAAEYGSLEVVELLRKHGANEDALNEDGLTATELIGLR